MDELNSIVQKMIDAGESEHKAIAKDSKGIVEYVFV